jgi:hypothetical protein
MNYKDTINMKAKESRFQIMMSALSVPLLMGLMFLLAIGCKKHDVYPIEPSIAYQSFTKIADGTGIDNKAYLTISFTDGDGDIGLEAEDTLPPYNINGDYYYNFLIDYYELQGDSFVKVDLPSSFNARIPYVNDDLAERGIRGEINIELFFNNQFSTSDSIRFTAQIIDRALHKSNIITTPSIYVKKTP